MIQIVSKPKISFVRMLFIGFFLMLLSLASVKQPVSAGTDDGLIFYLTFDSSYKDSVSGNSFTAYGDSSFSTGVIGKALYMDGDGDYIDLGTGYNLNDTDFTFSVWVKSESETRSDAALLAKYETNHYGPYDFYLSYNRPAFWVSNGSGGYKEYVSNTKLESSTWYLLTYTYRQSTSQMSIYINGKLDTSFDCISITSRSDKVTIGRQALMFSSYSQLQYKGYLDDMRLYSRALSTSEISSLYSMKSSTYKITFKANGGETPSKTSMTVKKGSVIASLPSCQRSGYKFLGWYTQKSGGTKVTAYTVCSSNMTLYAHWQKVSVSKASIKSLTSGSSGKIKVKLKSVSGAKGYQIAYAVKKSGAYTKKRTGKLTYTLSGLTSGKTYYVKVRAYKTDSKGERVYGSWSSVKKITVS